MVRFKTPERKLEMIRLRSTQDAFRIPTGWRLYRWWRRALLAFSRMNGGRCQLYKYAKRRL